MSESKHNLPGNPAPGTDTQADGPVNPSRRRLTGAGLGVSAIFTLASQPVLANTCLSPSAACSGNLSPARYAPHVHRCDPGLLENSYRTWGMAFTLSTRKLLNVLQQQA